LKQKVLKAKDLGKMDEVEKMAVLFKNIGE
jgi:hypothetical protein